MTMTADPLLHVEDLTTRFHTDEGVVRAVEDVSFDVRPGETVCLVGESGSGKTVTAESITRLVECPPGEIRGNVWFRGEDLATASERRLRELRGAEIAHVFQNPQDALNPVYTVGTQVGEVLRIHEGLSKRAARKRAIDLLDRVDIPDPATTVDAYPHELSGGMKQRVLIAVALAGNPDLLIADEPTTALDVTIQAGILDLLAELQAEFDMAVLFITHDLGVVARVADRVVVLYAGKVMERGPVGAVFHEPAHPYTRALMACLPGRGQASGSIDGELPEPTDPPDGCRFAPRCPFAVDDCHDGTHPPLVGVDGAGDRDAACLFHGPGYDRSHLDREVAWGAESTVEADGRGEHDGAGDGEECDGAGDGEERDGAGDGEGRDGEGEGERREWGRPQDDPDDPPEEDDRQGGGTDD